MKGVRSADELELHPIAYLSVEVRSRELASKVLVACELVERGVTAVIGQQWLMNNNIPHQPPGIMMFKGLNKVQTWNMRYAIDHGHCPVSNDEEAMGVAVGVWLSKDVDPDVGRHVLKIFAQGAAHQKALIEHSRLPASRVPITGNPRLDLLRPEFLRVYEEEAERIRAEHGRFILINTNMAGVNSRWGDANEYREVLVRIGWIDLDNPDDQVLFDEHMEHDRKNLYEIQKLIAILSRVMPEQKIVVRPHPAENADEWVKLYAKAPNVTVVPRSDHIPWMMAAAVMVNTGCTTGVEAQIMGISTMSVCSDTSRWKGFYLANLVNVLARRAEDATGVLESFLAGKSDVFADTRPLLRERLKTYIGGLDETYSFETIADEIAGMLKPEDRARGVPRFWEKPEYKKEMDRIDYYKDKMTLSEEELCAMIVNLRSAAGKHANFKVTTIADSIFVIEKG